jgi:hypothetical protein
MRKAFIVVLIAAGIGIFLPPLFTHGACTSEFDAVGDLLEHSRGELLTLPQAEAFLKTHRLAYEELSAERCESWHPADVLECPSGVLLLGVVPVSNRICRYYRDNNVRFQLGFNNHSQLIRIQTDMNPYRILKLPVVDLEIEVAK